MWLAVHDAVVDLLGGSVVIFDAVALGAGVRNLDNGRGLLTSLVRAKVERAQAGFDWATPLSKYVTDGSRAHECVVRGLSVANPHEAVVAPLLVHIGQASSTQRLKSLRRSADMDQRRSILIGDRNEVVPSAADGTDAGDIGARAQKDRHEARDAGFRRRFVDHVGIGEAEVWARLRDIVDHYSERIVIDLQRRGGDNGRCRAGERRR